MMKTDADLVIKGGRVVTPECTYEADIAVRDGSILSCGDPSTMPCAGEVIDASGRFVLPGAIDSHVHFREPGYTHKEDWHTGTAAAAAGGCDDGVRDAQHEPSDRLRGGARRQAGPRRAAGACRFRNLRTPGRGQHRGARCAGRQRRRGLQVLHGQYVRRSARPVRRRHAGGLRDPGTPGGSVAPSTPRMRPSWPGGRCSSSGRDVPTRWRTWRHVRRSARWKRSAAPFAFAEWTGARLHIAHKSSKDALYLVRDAKARGVDVTVETCPHYLIFDTGDMLRLGGVLRVNPPIREPGHGDALWQALADGTIDMIATDHAPHLPDEKSHRHDLAVRMRISGRGDADAGDAHRGQSRPDHAQPVRAVDGGESPAIAWGLYPRKGVLQPGADADIVIVDMERTETIDQERLHSRSRISPWHGRSVQGVPVCTIVRGAVVMRDGKVVGAPGWGRPVRQQMPPPRPRNTDKTSAAICRVPASFG